MIQSHENRETDAKSDKRIILIATLRIFSPHIFACVTDAKRSTRKQHCIDVLAQPPLIICALERSSSDAMNLA